MRHYQMVFLLSLLLSDFMNEINGERFFASQEWERYDGTPRYPSSIPLFSQSRRSLLPEFQAVAIPVSSDSQSISNTKGEEYGASTDQLTGLWPPWPFNLLSRKRALIPLSSSASDIAAPTLGSRKYTPRLGPAGIAWAFTVSSLQVTFKNFQDIASNLWCHLPPAAPPFLILAVIPRRETVQYFTESGVEEFSSRFVIPLISNGFCRSIAFAGAGVGIVSWAHHDFHRKQSLTPLPLSEQYRDSNRAVLPPFLPEERPIDSDLLGSDTSRTIPALTNNLIEDGEKAEQVKGKVPRRLRRHWNQFLETPPESPFARRINEWKRTKELNRLRRFNEGRRAIYDELVALQALKKKTSSRNAYGQFRKRSTLSSAEEEESKTLGYALVTGASRGIGRAIAVELARWEIPLILVARDVDRLTSLANDLEACYGVKCCVLQADLAKPGVAENIYKTTEQAGLKVDILVNNAGFSTQGIAVDRPVKESTDMMQLNAVSPSILASLYGRGMKMRRRGRILIVSSICGSIAGIPSVALYSATKAFQNSLATAMAVELESSGVGVTCLTPGAVRDTEFRSLSKTDQALCWKVPFYAKSPPYVAEQGVRALLRGDTEVTPGWQNRLFVKVLQPCLPQRLHSLVAEIMWTPLRLSFRRRYDAQLYPSTEEDDETFDEVHSPSLPPSESEPKYPAIEDRNIEENSLPGRLQNEDNHTEENSSAYRQYYEGSEREAEFPLEHKNEAGQEEVSAIEEPLHPPSAAASNFSNPFPSQGADISY